MYIVKINKNMVSISYNSPIPFNSSGGIRDKVKSFSRQSRSRLLKFIMGHEKPDYMLTLTFPDWININCVKFKDFKRKFEKFLIRNQIDYIYKIEFTKKQIPHIHYLIYHPAGPDYIDKNKIKLFILSLFVKNFELNNFQVNKIMKFQLDDRIFTKVDNMDVAMYYSFYVSKSKKKEYQNIVPESYSIRFWGYSSGIKLYKITSEIFIENDDNKELRKIIENIKDDIGYKDEVRDYIQTVNIFNLKNDKEKLYYKIVNLLFEMSNIQNYKKYFEKNIENYA